MHVLPPALMPLAAFNQFIVYKLIPKKDKPGKTDKFPIDHRTGQMFAKGANWQQDPAAWTSADNAIAIAMALGSDHGVGFFFTANDPFWFIDIDGCLMPNGEWSPVALDLVDRTRGCAVEVSQSGKGLHIFGTGAVPDHACKNIAAGLELYTESRFVALTGTRAAGNASLPGAMDGVVAQYFTPTVTARDATWTNEPTPEYTPFDDDDKLIKAAIKSKSAANKFGGKASFADLWTRNVPMLAETYPPDASSSEEYDGSSADMALATGLAFWTGCNCDHILALMWASGLVRDKWTKHKSYLHDTITNAVSIQKTVYTANKPRVSVRPTETMIASVMVAEGYQFLAATQQLEHFTGCVYVQDQHKIFTPQGMLLKPEVFNATYGGYVFQLDADSGGKTTKKAWEAFTESQVLRYPKAESTCFRPDLESGVLIIEEGRTLVNTYVPVITERQSGDVTPFLEHLAKVLPDEDDRAILLAYMAAVIQHKGVKFQWAPLIQGVEGNGKTLFSRCVAFAIGERYTHMPPAEQLAEKFNAWFFDKIFIGVEDIYVPDHKNEIIEILKPMITNTRYAKRDMGVGQVMHNVCANFMFNSNHKDAVRKTRNDRRFCIFYCAQQLDTDIIKDGMGGDYFPDLYKWLRGGGYATVAKYLEEYAIPEELNPAGSCHRAPNTTSTDEAINSSMGGIEQEVMEAIEEGRAGFAGGWISSMAFDKLLHDLNATRRIPPTKRRSLLQSLGYDWHPNLPKGRSTSQILLDQGKPRLFIKDGHIHRNLTTGAEIAHAYSNAQAGVIAEETANKFANN